MLVKRCIQLMAVMAIVGHNPRVHNGKETTPRYHPRLRMCETFLREAKRLQYRLQSLAVLHAVGRTVDESHAWGPLSGRLFTDIRKHTFAFEGVGCGCGRALVRAAFRTRMQVHFHVWRGRMPTPSSACRPIPRSLASGGAVREREHGEEGFLCMKRVRRPTMIV